MRRIACLLVGVVLAWSCTAWADEEIAFVQECLLVMAYRPGPVDGKQGPKTDRAFMRYMRDRFGTGWLDVPDEVAAEQFLADCEQAYTRRHAGPTLPLHNY